jgi:hypothetical protein
MNQREGERDNSSQSWVENTNMTDCISSLNARINARRKVPLQVNFFTYLLVYLCDDSHRPE